MKHVFETLKSCSKCPASNVAYVAHKLYATAVGGILNRMFKRKNVQFGMQQNVAQYVVVVSIVIVLKAFV